MSAARPWRPLLDGALRARALAMVDALAASLAAPPAAAEPWSECSLFLGDPGKAIFFAELERHQPGRGHLERAAAIIETAAEGIGAISDRPQLIGGFVGTAWAIEHLRAPLGIDADVNDAIDEALLELVDGDLGAFGWELLIGVAGWGVYALERSPAPGGARLLARVAARLEELAERVPDGLRWRCPEWMPILATQGARFPQGCYPLDPAHGALGPVAVLAGARAAGLSAAADALAGAVRWLLAQRFADGPLRFPAYAGDAERGLGWCKGDPGVAGVLGAVAEIVDEPAWAEVARETALQVARVAPSARPGAGGLCHGLAGLGHILNRAWQRWDEPALADAARDCFARALAQSPTGRVALLDGDAGVALALLAASTDSVPAWDRVLLLSHRHG